MALARGKSSDKWDFILFNHFVAIPQMRSFNMENLKLGRGLFGSNLAKIETLSAAVPGHD